MERTIDFTKITACGECCADCKKRMDGRCKVHECARKHNVQFCGLCGEFPCEQLPSIIQWNPDIIEHLSALAERYHEQEE